MARGSGVTILYIIFCGLSLIRIFFPLSLVNTLHSFLYRHCSRYIHGLYTLFYRKLTLVAGLDISYPKDAHSQSSCVAFTAVVICSFPELKIIYEETQEVKLDTPYVPGIYINITTVIRQWDQIHRSVYFYFEHLRIFSI